VTTMERETPLMKAVRLTDVVLMNVVAVVGANPRLGGGLYWLSRRR
jgi:hypothetical protein